MDISRMSYATRTRCMHRHDVSRSAAVLAGVFGLLLGVGGCTGEDPSQPVSLASKPAPPSIEEIPGCSEVAAILGDLVVDLVPVAGDDVIGGLDDGRFHRANEYGVSCEWLTRKALSGNPFEQIKEGSFGIGITVDRRHPQEEAPLRSIGMVYDDPRVQAIGGFVVDMSGHLNPADQLGAVGPLVVVGDVVVSMSAVGIYLQKVESMQAITTGRGIEAAVALHKSLQ